MSKAVVQPLNHSCFSDKKLTNSGVFLINLKEPQNNFMQVIRWRKACWFSVKSNYSSQKLKLCMHLKTEFN